MNIPLKGFIAYSHENSKAKDTLRAYLAVMEQQNKLVTWHDGDITTGDKARQEDILKEVADSNILLYLVSAWSLASENCNKELAEALKENLRVIPIILEACDWENHQLSNFEVRPSKGKAINKWAPESDGWNNVVRGIREVVDKMISQPKPSPRITKTEIRILASWALQRGNFLLMLNQIDKAIIAYSRTIELDPNDAYAYTNRGIAYGEKGKVDRAIVDYNKAIKLKPNLVEAYNARGIAFDRKCEYSLAISDLNHAIDLNPNYAIAYSNRGLAYLNEGDVDRAISDLNKAIQLKPTFVEAYFNRGGVYYERREFDRAIEDYNKAIELRPFYPEYYNRRGLAHRERCNYHRAILDFTKTIELKPDHYESYCNRGIAYDNKGEFDRAIEDYSKAIKLKPDFAEAHYNRGNIYSDTGKFDCAIEDYTKAINLIPDDADTYTNRGVVHEKIGNLDVAIKDYAKAIDLKPNSAHAYCNRGNAYDNKGEIDNAIEDYTKAIKIKPDHIGAYLNRGAAYVNKGEPNRAIIDFDKVIDIKPDCADAYLNRGAAYVKKGEWDRAIVDFEKVIDIKPHYGAGYSNRGAAYLYKGEHDRAILDFTKAITLNPNLAEAYYNRGAVHCDNGDVNLGIADFNKAIEIKRDYADAYYGRGAAWLRLRKWEKAKSDLTIAKNKGMDIIAAFHNDYNSVEAYERINRVELPADIATMLTQRRRSRFPKTQRFLRSDGTPFESPDVLNLLAKLRNAGTPLSQCVQTRPTFGIKTGSSGAFVVDGAVRDQLIADHPASVEVLKPFLQGGDIRRWRVSRPDAWLIFTYRRIEINRYPAIRKHLEKYRSRLSKRAGKQKWYELPAAKRDVELFTQTKLICPNSYDHQTFAVDTDGFYCGDTCYLIPTEETWLCGLLNSRVVEWFYSQASDQLTGDYLKARSHYMKEIPIPDLTTTQKSQIGKIVDYLIYLQGQPTTRGVDLAHARDFIMFKYFERIIDGLVYESYLREDLHHGDKQFFKPLLDERLPQLEEIRDDKMSALREIFERLYERSHPVRINLFFLDSVKPIRVIEGKA